MNIYELGIPTVKKKAKLKISLKVKGKWKIMFSLTAKRSIDMKDVVVLKINNCVSIMGFLIRKFGV